MNRLEHKVLPYSELNWFLDNERDENGKLIRPNIYLWDAPGAFVNNKVRIKAYHNVHLSKNH